MTITDTYLVGSPETFDETIRKWLYDNWVPANTQSVTPKIISPHGTNNAAADYTSTKSANAWMLDINKDFIRIKQIKTERTPDKAGGLGVVRLKSTLTIDIFAETPYRQFLFEREVNRIIAQGIPNTQVRINKTDGTNSAIATLDRENIDWLPIAEFKDAGIVRQSYGELGIIWQRQKS